MVAYLLFVEGFVDGMFACGSLFKIDEMIFLLILSS